MNTRLNKKRARQRGMTLIEIMVVITILAVLGGIVALNVLPQADNARVGAAQNQIDIFDQALSLYSLHNGRYPTTEEGLEALIVPPRSLRNAATYQEGGYIDADEVPRDPWGNEYEYTYPGATGRYDIISYGRDGQPGGTGPDADITK